MSYYLSYAKLRLINKKERLKMLLIKGYVETDRQGSRSEFQLKLPSNSTKEEIDSAAEKVMLSKIDWDYQCEEIED